MINEVLSPNVTLIVPDRFSKINLEIESTQILNGDIVVIDVSPRTGTMALIMEFDRLQHLYFEKGHVYPVGINGTDLTNEPGSERFCIQSMGLAGLIEELVAKSLALDSIRSSDGSYWGMSGCSKYFRMMSYQKGGQHFPHWDSDFPCNKNSLTRYSCIMYFDNCEDGEIAFIHNPPSEYLMTKQDWDRQATDEEISVRIKPKVGRIVIFPHTRCHTVLPFTGPGMRRIARGDLIFTKNKD